MILKLQNREVSNRGSDKRSKREAISGSMKGRLEAALARVIEYIAHPDFDKPGVRSAILSPILPGSPLPPRRVKRRQR